MKFTWIKTYKELANWLMSKQDKQKELIQILKEAGVDSFRDVDQDGREIDLEEIDPFSFFAYINKYKTDERRLEVL